MKELKRTITFLDSLIESHKGKHDLVSLKIMSRAMSTKSDLIILINLLEGNKR